MSTNPRVAGTHDFCSSRAVSRRALAGGETPAERRSRNRARGVRAWGRARALGLATAAILLSGTTARADDTGASAQAADAPDAPQAPATSSAPRSAYEVPSPLDRAPFWALGFHAAWLVPVSVAPLCPANEGCVMNGGLQVRFGAERRWARGWTLGASYEATLFDSDAAYELGVLQALRVLGRHLWSDTTNVHPFVGVGLGPAMFGDTFTVDTGGALLDVVVGAEIELSDTLWLSVALPWRVLYLAPFTTEADGVRRAKSGASTAFMLEVGLAVLEAP